MDDLEYARFAANLWAERSARMERGYDILRESMQLFVEAEEHVRRARNQSVQWEKDPLDILRLALELTMLHPDPERVDELRQRLGLPCASSSKTPSGSAADASTGTASATPTAPTAT